MLSKSTADEIRRVIDGHLVQQQLSLGAGSPSVDFCTIWPQAKPVIDVLIHLVPLIPTVGPAAGAAVKALVMVADAAYQNTCVKKPAATAP